MTIPPSYLHLLGNWGLLHALLPAVLKAPQNTPFSLEVTMANWEAIRSLDEEENWVERNRVLSKTDHLEIVANAKVCMQTV